MPQRLVVPHVGWSGSAVLKRWLKEDGAWVAKSTPVCLLSIDDVPVPLVAHHEGFLRVRRPPHRLGTRLARHVELGRIVGMNEPPDALAEPPALPARLPMRLDRRLATRLAKAIPLTRRPRSTPRARRAAAERGIDLATLKGTGPNGRIQYRDIPAPPPEPVPEPAEPSQLTSPPDTSPAAVTPVLTPLPADQTVANRPLVSSQVRVRPMAFVQSDWRFTAPTPPATSSAQPIDRSAYLPGLLWQVGEALVGFPELLSRPLPASGELVLRWDAWNGEELVARLLSWAPQQSPDALLDSATTSSDRAANFRCIECPPGIACGTPLIDEDERCVLTLGAPRPLGLPPSTNCQHVPWHCMLTLSFDGSQVDWWQAARWLGTLTARAPAWE